VRLRAVRNEEATREEESVRATRMDSVSLRLLVDLVCNRREIRHELNAHELKPTDATDGARQELAVWPRSFSGKTTGRIAFTRKNRHDPLSVPLPPS
jgi:hypothetical protein